MGVYSGMHEVVHFGNGELWHFFYKKDKGILFRRMEGNGTWGNPIELVLNTQEDFSLRIDDRDNLHLICRSNTGEILYMQFNGKIWSTQVLSRYETTRYTLKYPSIIILDNHIHILFAIGTTFNTGLWSLCHYHWDEHSWHSTEITKFTAGQRLSPFFCDLSEKHIHLVFRGLTSNRYQIFHCRFHIDHGIWSTPENVTHSSSDCNMPAILLKDKHLHLVWISLNKNDLIVSYRKKIMDPLTKTGWDKEVPLSSSGSNAAFPHLLWIEGKLWCLWFQNDTLMSAGSEDNGLSWEPALPVHSQNKQRFHLVNYSTNDLVEKERIKLQRTLGSIENGFYLPLASDFIKIPSYSPLESPLPFDITSTDSQQENSNKAHKETTRNAPLPSPARKSYSMQVCEQVVVKEFERQEEYFYNIFSKLDDLLRANEEINIQGKALALLLKEHHDLLEMLILEVSEIKKELKQKPGLIHRIFSSKRTDN